MSKSTQTTAVDPTPRARELMREHQDGVYAQTSHLFAILMAVQWLFGIAAALWISPRTWVGTSSQVHLHVWLAIFLGGALTAAPIFLALTRPTEVFTRHVVAVAQMLMSALLIHLTGGRIETHFHVFGSLAFLAYYRDWRVLVPATIVVAADHAFRGLYYPQSVFGILTASPWRWLEHAGWVIFEDVILVKFCVRGVAEMWEIAQRQASIEAITEDLRRAKDAAESANRAKSAFLANISHEIRTPLNAILGYSQLTIRDSGLVKQAARNLDIINRSGNHLLGLINDILDMSKIEAGQAEVHTGTFDLLDLVEGVSAMFRLRAESKGLKFQVCVTPGCPHYLESDRGKITQVLINLLGNAVKFTDKGFITVTVTVEQESDGAHWLIVQVTDSGFGIAPEEQDSLFLPFAQSKSGRNAQNGTGLGLAISQEFAKLLGGRITLTSEVGQGSTFRFAVPVELKEGEAVLEASEHRGVAGLQPGVDPPRILVVDDDPNNRGWLGGVLVLMGFTVREAQDGQEALLVWEEWKPHAILMDLQMPNMDGLTATRNIRARAEGKDTVIIALTASALDGDRRLAIESGVTDFLSKPVRENQVTAILGSHLQLAFRYTDVEPPVATGSVGSVAAGATAQPLQEVPVELRSALLTAVRKGEKASLDRLIEEVGHQHGPCAVTLRDLADRYEYDALIQLLEETRS